MARAIVVKTHTSNGDYNDRNRRGYVSIEIKARELAQRDDEWRGVMYNDYEAGAKLRKALNKDVIKLIKELYPDSKIAFSQKAGCSCGCSPGYYVKNASGESILKNGITVFVEIVD